MRWISILLFAGCTGQFTGGDDQIQGDDQPPVCPTTRSYTGFDGTPLESARRAIPAGSDRVRLKPFSALATEYARALRLTSFDTSDYATTFGKPPARWYGEPQASANTIYAAFALAFTACTQETATDAVYASAPDATSAGLVCRDHARRAWHREATDDEAAACVDYAVNHTPTTDAPRKRWAYTCAAVIGASGFLAY
jgi:hypothetical protein